MKCVKKNEEIKRVSDTIAMDLVTNKGWAYAAKQEYKTIMKKKPVVAPIPEPAQLPDPSEPVKKVSKKKEKK